MSNRFRTVVDEPTAKALVKIRNTAEKAIQDAADIHPGVLSAMETRRSAASQLRKFNKREQELSGADGGTDRFRTIVDEDTAKALKNLRTKAEAAIQAAATAAGGVCGTLSAILKIRQLAATELREFNSVDA